MDCFEYMTQDQREGYRFTRGMNDLTKSENLSRIDEPTGEVDNSIKEKINAQWGRRFNSYVGKK